MTAETSQTLDRGLRVLKLLADTDHGLTVTELAARLGVNRTVVYRLLATLEQHALVRRDLGGRARVGLGVLGLAHQVHPLLREAALPALRSLAEDIGATAHLTLVDGTEALAVAVVEPTWTDFHVAYRTGFRHSLDRSAAGRAILHGRRLSGRVGALPYGEAEGEGDDEYGYGSPRDGAAPAASPQAVPGAGPGAALLPDGRYVTRVEDTPYVISHGDLDSGATGAAAPLLGVTGIEGCVGVVMLADSVPERVGPRVAEAATEVADALR